MASIDATIEKCKRQSRALTERPRDGEAFEEFIARVRAS
jgi:hypothetical protein